MSHEDVAGVQQEKLPWGSPAVSSQLERLEDSASLNCGEALTVSNCLKTGAVSLRLFLYFGEIYLASKMCAFDTCSNLGQNLARGASKLTVSNVRDNIL